MLDLFGYDPASSAGQAGRRTALTRGNGTISTYGYDGLGRLSGLTLDLAGTGYDHAITLDRNPAGQIAGRTGSNSYYSYGHSNGNRDTSVNGLNQVASSGPYATSHDARGNTTGIGSKRGGSRPACAEGERADRDFRRGRLGIHARDGFAGRKTDPGSSPG